MQVTIIQASVTVCGGHLPYPIHSICDTALNTDHEYCTGDGEVYGKDYGVIDDSMSLHIGTITHV